MNNPLEVFNKIPPKYRFGVFAGTAGALGYIAYKRRKDASQLEAVSEAATGAEVDVNGGEYPSSGTPGGYAPVIISGTNAAPATDFSGIGDLVSQYISGINLTADRFSTWADRVMDSSDIAHQQVYDIATGGSSMQQPAQITINPMVIPDTPVNVPTAAPTPAAPAAATKPQAPAGYPHWNESRKLWYKYVTASFASKDSNGKAYKKGDDLHVYQNGMVIKDN